MTARNAMKRTQRKGIQTFPNTRERIYLFSSKKWIISLRRLGKINTLSQILKAVKFIFYNFTFRLDTINGGTKRKIRENLNFLSGYLVKSIIRPECFVWIVIVIIIDSQWTPCNAINPVKPNSWTLEDVKHKFFQILQE